MKKISLKKTDLNLIIGAHPGVIALNNRITALQAVNSVFAKFLPLIMDFGDEKQKNKNEKQTQNRIVIKEFPNSYLSNFTKISVKLTEII